MRKVSSGLGNGRTALLMAGVAILALPSAAMAQPAASKDTNLGSTTVTYDAIDETEAGYKISRTTSATRTDTPLVDVPQSVSVISLKQIEDQAATNIGDAIRYTPGVFSAQGEGNRETLVFRGNTTTGDFFVDGVRDDVQTYRDLYNIDQLQIFKGPNAMIFGRGGVGGIVNRVTKVADGRQMLSARIEGGSFEHKRAQLDMGTPLGEMASIRLTAVTQDSDSYRDGVTYNRWGFNPTATFKLGANTTLTLGYEHFQDDRVADRGVSSYLGVAVPTSRGQFFGSAAQSPTWTNTDAGSLFLEHRFSDTLVIRNHTRYANYDKFYQNVFAGTVNTAAETITLATTNRAGLATGSYAAGSFVQISAYNNATERTNFISQTDLNAEFDTGGIKHTLLLGFEYGRQITDNVRLEGRFSGTSPSGSTFTGQASVYTPLTQTTITYPINWTAISSSGNNRGRATVAAGYIQDQIEISPMFQIIAGIRYESFKTFVHDRRSAAFRTSGTPAVTSPEFYNVTDNLWSPRLGLIFKPVENASLYASYSKTFLPRGGDQLTGLNLANSSFDPEVYQNYEVGAKWDIFPAFSVTGAVFQLDRKNVIALSNPNDPASATIPIGRQRTRGVELSASGNITDQLSIVGAYTYSDGTFRDNVSGTVKAGNMLANMPKHSASLWTRYDPIEKLGLGVGVMYQSKRFAATDNSVYMPHFTRVDAAIYYTISDAVSAQVNVENVLGEHYYLYANSNTNITPGSPTAFKAGLNVRF